MSRRALAALGADVLPRRRRAHDRIETPLTRALGVACLFAFVAGGPFLIVDPVLLSDEGDADR